MQKHVLRLARSRGRVAAKEPAGSCPRPTTTTSGAARQGAGPPGPSGDVSLSPAPPHTLALSPMVFTDDAVLRVPCGQ